MNMKTKLLAAGAALLLSAASALAVPATVETDLNVRSGPGTQFPVIGSIPDGQTVDVANCSGAWCQVSFSGGTGYASQNYLEIGGAVAPGPAVAVSPYVYDDDDYDYGYTYGPSIGFYAGPRHWRGHRWHGGWRGHAGNWQGHGNWNRPGRPGGTPPVASGAGRAAGFAGPPANWQRPGTGIGAGGAARGSGFAGGGGRAAAAPSVPAGGGGAQPGFAGSMVRGTR